MIVEVVHDSLRLALCGGKDATPVRGMTLWAETSYIDRVIKRLFDLDLLLETHKALTERALRVYGPNTRGYNECVAMLEAIVKLKESNPSTAEIPAKLLELGLITLPVKE